MTIRAAAAVLAVFFLADIMPPAMAQHAHHGAPPAAEGKAPKIAGLSDDDIAALKRGGGMGFAKAAELNGVPGPAHLLELKDRIPLTQDQVAAVEAEFAAMKAAAIAEGARLIAGERALDAAFRAGGLDDDGLRRLLADIEASRAALRVIHLSAHLRMPPLLSPAQVARYGELRGNSAVHKEGKAN